MYTSIADMKVISVKFSWGSERQKTPQANFFVGSGPPNHYGIGVYDQSYTEKLAKRRVK